MSKKDPQQIQTVEELKEIVANSESRSRVKFASKVFYILQFVESHPDKMDELGASWCKDKKHFISNSKKLAKFLDLKSNSINTNFRDHGYKIISSNNNDLRKEFPTIQETRHWKKRYSTSPFFTKDSTLKEVDQIKLLDQTINSILPDIDNIQQSNSTDTSANVATPSTNLNNKGLHFPNETIELLKNDFSQLYEIARLFYAISEDENYYFKFLQCVTKIWLSKIQSGEADIETVVSIIIGKDINSDSEPFLLQYQRNLESLLLQNTEDSQISDTIFFSSFVKFFIRYSDIFNMASVLYEISVINMYMQQDCQSFQSWFMESKKQAVKKLSKKRKDDWFLVPSQTPNMFTLLVNTESPSTINAIHIKHNPIPDDESKRYSVTFNDGEKYYTTLNMIFTDLNLYIPEQLSMNGKKEPQVKYVNAEDIKNRQRDTDYYYNNADISYSAGTSAIDNNGDSQNYDWALNTPDSQLVSQFNSQNNDDDF